MNAVLKPAYVFARESIREVRGEIQPLLAAHYAELALFKEIALEPDYARYEVMEKAQALRIYTLRWCGALIGYAIFAVDHSLHYRSSLQAVQDVIYLAPEYRNGRLGLKLIQFAEKALWAEGVEVIRHHVKRAHPALGRLLESLGYVPEDLLYAKRLT